MSRKPASVADLLARGLAEAVEVGECLEWQGPFGCNGKTPVVKSREGKTYTYGHAVCRLVWEAKNGPVPEGHKVYRSCCNNACVDEKHLKCGTPAEWQKHRKKMGQTAHALATKLKITAARRKSATTVYTLEKAREVRSLIGSLTYQGIADATGVHKDVVADIVQGRAWKESVASPFAGLGAANDSARRSA